MSLEQALLGYGPLPVHVSTADFVTVKWSAIRDVNVPDTSVHMLKLFTQHIAE